MGRKSNEQSYRGKGKYRTGRREKRRTVSYADDEETGNDTVVEYTTEEEENDSESEEDDYACRRRVPPKRHSRSCFHCWSCSKARMKCWHECIRDLAIILILILLICATLKDWQLNIIMNLYEQAYNFTHSEPENTQRQHHTKSRYHRQRDGPYESHDQSYED